MMYSKLVISVITLLVWLEVGDCLKCYQCESHIEPDCKEKLDDADINSLTIKSTECRVDAAEYCIKATGVWGGIVGTRRFCSSRDMGVQCQYLSYSDHDRKYRACTYTCGTDDCNGGIGVPISLAVLIASSLFAIFHQFL